MDAKRVMLLNMPISTRERPSIGLSLLKAALLRDGIACDVKYFNLRFAELIGEAYHDQIVDSISYPLLGEWIFAEDLFGDRIPAPEKYFTDVLDPGMAFSTVAETHITHQRDEILRIREKVRSVFDEYVSEIKKYDFKKMDPYLFLETSRGCWWGEKSHCTFCGSNGSVMFFRSKSPDRAIQEILYLTENYDIKKIQTVDDIMDIRYFRDVLPRLKELNLPIELFYETKANLRKEQVFQFRDSGVLAIQPGIESLSTDILKLMRKGVTMLQNIQLLKWCAEFMIAPYWNVLAGFAGEDPDEYARQAELVPLVSHLPPPQPLRLVKLQRFAPMHFNSEQFGLRNVRAMKAYEYIYPFPIEELNELAFQFDFEFGDGRKPMDYVDVLKRAVEDWASLDNNAVLNSRIVGQEMLIRDTRAVALQEEYCFTGMRRAIYEVCHAAHNITDIKKHLAASLALDEVSDETVEQILAEFMQARLMISENGRYLSLAVDLSFKEKLVADLVMSSMVYYSAD